MSSAAPLTTVSLCFSLDDPSNVVSTLKISMMSSAVLREPGSRAD